MTALSRRSQTASKPGYIVWHTAPNATQMICQSGITSMRQHRASINSTVFLIRFIVWHDHDIDYSIVARAVADAATAREIDVTNREGSAIGHRPDSTKRLNFGRPISIVNFFL